MPVTTYTTRPKQPTTAALAPAAQQAQQQSGTSARPAPLATQSSLQTAGTAARSTAAPAPTVQNATTASQQFDPVAAARALQQVPIQQPATGQNQVQTLGAGMYINEYGQPAVRPPTVAPQVQAPPPQVPLQQAQQAAPQAPRQTQDFLGIGAAAEDAWNTYGPYVAPLPYYGTQAAVDLIGAGVDAVTGGSGGGTAPPAPTSGAPPGMPATTQFTTVPGATGPGITGGVQQGQFVGADMTTPGASEQFFSDNAWRFALPNALTEQGAWWEQNQGQVGAPGVGESAYDAVAPGLSKAGSGENYVNALTGQYGPGEYPTGTNLSSDYAGSYRPTALGQGIGERVGEEIGNTYRPGETPDVSNRSEEFYQKFLGEMPDINTDAGLEPYYANARRKAAEEINRTMAARGMWGSSAAGDLIGEANVNLGAEQANREAQYYLDTLGEKRNWQNTGGTLAGAADDSSRSQSENERAWTTDLAGIANDAQGLEIERAGENRAQTALGSDIMRSADDVTNRNASLERDWASTMGGLGLEGDAASRARASTLMSGANDAQRAMLERLGFGQEVAAGIDDSELRRLSAGQQAAGTAQNSARTRAQDYFNNTMGMGNAMAGVMGEQYNPMITEDKTLLDDILAMLTGSGAERLAGATRETAGAQQTQNSQQQGLMQLLSLLALA